MTRRRDQPAPRAAARYVGVFSVRWGNPYTEPPDGGARVLLRVEQPPGASSADRPAAILAALAAAPPGYVLGWDWRSLAAPRPWPLARKQRERRRRLRVRLTRAVPLLAEIEYARALAARPDYYGAD